MTDTPLTTESGTPLPIAFFITDLDPGGAERALVQVLRRLDRGRWAPLVLCLGPEAELVREIRELGIPVECCGARHARHLPGAIWWGARRLRRHRPRILQCLLFHANIVGRLAGRCAGVPVILAGHRVAEREKHWHLTLERLTRRLVDHHVCVSQGVAEHVRDVVGLPVEAVTVIPNGVDMSDSIVPVDLTAEFGIPAGRKVVLAAGRLHRQKGFDLLLEAFALVRRDDPDVHLLILGDGLERLSLLKRIGELELDDFVTLPGRRENLRGIMAASSVFVLSSRWEGMPNVVLEAMATGLPVVAAPVEGIPELIVDGVRGFVASPERAMEFADRVTLLIHDRTRRRDFVKSSQDLIRESFTWNRIASEYDRLYCDLLGVYQK